MTLEASDGSPRGEMESPLKVEFASDVSWDRETQILVVGFGGAGACAAIEAHDAGANVLVIDRFDGGGATAYSGGIHYAGGTRFQHDAGYSDTSEEMYKYLSLEVGDAVSDRTLRKFCDDSVANIEWLERQGVQFGGGVHTGKTVYPPDGKFLYFSGNEMVPEYKAKAYAAPRGHRVIGKGYTGHIYYAAMRQAVERRSLPVMTHTRAVRLIVDGSDRVIGVEALVLPEFAHARHRALYKDATPTPFTFEKAERSIRRCRDLEVEKGRRIRIRATSGVILTTGGFEFSMPMLKKHTTRFAAFAPAMLRMGAMGSDGSGIQLGQSVGGRVGKLGNVFYGRIISPPTAFVEGILVNKLGRRFVNEDAYVAVVGNAISEQPEGQAWILMDAPTVRKLRKQLMPHGDGQFLQWSLPALANVLFGGTKRGGSLKILAKRCGIDASGLESQVQETRTTAAQGLPDPIGKSPNYFRPVEDGPYCAVNVSVMNKLAMAPFVTLGGLAVDEDTGEVLDGQGRAIGGLYAAGRAAIGICGNRYMSGMSLADCVFSGRRAAVHCSKSGEKSAPQIGLARHA